CERCWYFYPSVGQNADKPDLCQRCVDVILKRF
ncbi:MAG: zinc finger domain-containing protein, partial [Planctomycetota bacterium]